jgi:hypothetical protein
MSRKFVFGGSFSGVDADALAFLTAALITDPVIKTAINTLVVQLKENGIWSKMIAVYPFVGGTATSHKWNLKDPQDTNAAFRLQFFGGVTHSIYGIQGNAINGYANTFVNHNLARLNGGLSAYVHNNLAQNSSVIRVQSSATVISQIIPRWTDNNSYIRNYATSSIAISNTDSRGFYGTSRLNSSQIIVNFKNVNNTYTHNLASITTNYPYYLMANNNQNTANGFSSHVISAITIHDNMTASDLTNLYNCIQYFQTILNREV